MKGTPDELAAARALADRLCTVALHHDVETFHAFALTAIAMALAPHRRHYGRHLGVQPSIDPHWCDARRGPPPCGSYRASAPRAAHVPASLQEIIMITNQSRRALLAGAPVAAAAVLAGGTVANAAAVAMANACEVDPIFGLIEAHRAAVLAVNATDDVNCKMRPSDPNSAAASQASSTASEAEMDALRDVLSCRPTTIGGVLALLDHLGQPQFLRPSRDPATVLTGAHEWYDDEEDDVRAWPHMLAAALRHIVDRGQA
jgi:hypothetical protein